MIGKKFTDLARRTDISGSEQVFIHTSQGAQRATVDDLLAEQSGVHIDNSTLTGCTIEGGTTIHDGVTTGEMEVTGNVGVGGECTINGILEVRQKIVAESGSVTGAEINVGSANVADPNGVQYWKGGRKIGHWLPTNVGIRFERDENVGAVEIAAPLELFEANPYVDFHANSSTDDYTTRIINFGSEPDTLMFLKSAASGSNLARCVGNFQTSSSRKLKDNIALISDYEAIDKIMEMEPVTFDYKWGDSSCGFIAEDMLSVLPEAVNVPEGYDEETFEYTGIESAAEAPSIDYTKIIPYLVKVVQSQQEEIEKLKRRCKH